jgi:hypothetical protein
MTAIETTARVGPDGVLTLALGPDAAGRDYSVTLTPTTPRLTPIQWRARMESAIAEWAVHRNGPMPRFPLPDYFGEAEKMELIRGQVGGWVGEFERPPQDIPDEKGCFD